MNLVLPKRELLLPRRMRRLSALRDQRGFLLNPFRFSGGGGGGGTPVLLYDSIVGGGGQWPFGNASPHDYSGQELFTDSVSRTITKIVGTITLGGSPTGRTVYCGIYEDVGANHDLGSLVQESDPVAQDPLWDGSVPTNVDFNFSTPAPLAPSTLYHIAWYSDSNAFGGGLNLQFVFSDLIPGQLSHWDGSGINQYPGTFPGADVQMQIWGN
jgi:hypothetical protein